MQQMPNLKPPKKPNILLLIFNIIVLLFGIPYFLETFSIFAAICLAFIILGTVQIVLRMIQYNRLTTSPSYPWTVQPPYQEIVSN